MKVRNFIGKYEQFSSPTFLKAPRDEKGNDESSMKRFFENSKKLIESNIEEDKSLFYHVMCFFEACRKDRDLTGVKWVGSNWGNCKFRIECDDPNNPGKTIVLATVKFVSIGSSSSSEPSNITIFTDNCPEFVYQYALDWFLPASGNIGNLLEQDFIKGSDGHQYTIFYNKKMYEF